jgi:hypothetical protein
MHLEAFAFEYLLAIMAFFILYLLYYVYTKDACYSRDIRSVATAVEELNREVYYIKQKLGKTQESVSENAQRMNDDMIYEEIERNIYDTIQPISMALKQVQESLNAVEMELSDRMMQLESGVKQISIPLSVHGNDDEKIIALFQQGIPLETISKELHISKPEVEFVLKINKLK